MVLEFYFDLQTRDDDTDSSRQSQNSAFLTPGSPFKWFWDNLVRSREYSKYIGSSTETQSVIEDTDSRDGSSVQTEDTLQTRQESNSSPAMSWFGVGKMINSFSCRCWIL